jgi:TPR repeat protein
MRLNFQATDQSEQLINNLKAKLFHEAHKSSHKSSFVRLSGLPLGFVSALFNIAKRINLIAENIIKCIGNLLGSCCIDTASFTTGLSQFFWHIPKNMLMLPLTILWAPFTFIKEAYQITKDPVNGTKELWFEHDPKAKRAEEVAIRELQLKVEIAAFNQCLEKVQKNPNDTEALKYVAHCYAFGKGTEKNEAESFNYSLKAAEQGDAQSMLFVGNAYVEGKVVKKNEGSALLWFEKAAKLKLKEGMTACGKLCEDFGDKIRYLGATQFLTGINDENGVISKQLKSNAEDWFKKAFEMYRDAAEQKDVQGMFQLGRMYALGKGCETSHKTAVLCLREAASGGIEPAVDYLAAILNLKRNANLKKYDTEGLDWSLKSKKMSEALSEISAAEREKQKPDAAAPS